MRLDTQSFFFFSSFMFLKSKEKAFCILWIVMEKPVYCSQSCRFWVTFASASTLCVFFFFGPAFLEANSINWRNIIILHFYFLVLDFDFCWGPVYARDPIQPIDGKEQYEGLNRHDNRCYWESPGCVCPPVFLFLMFFFSSLLAPISGKEKWWAGAAINHGIVDVDDGYWCLYPVLLSPIIDWPLHAIVSQEVLLISICIYILER